MYGAAGFGWILYIVIPSAVIALLNLLAQRRITRLRNQQRELINEWGKDVAVRPDSEASPEGVDIEENSATPSIDLDKHSDIKTSN